MSRKRLLAAVIIFIMVSLALPFSSLLAGWITDGAPVCTASGEQDRPRIIPSAQGGTIIVWEDRRTMTDIYGQRLDARGDIKWAVNGIQICHEDNTQNHPELIADGSGGAFVVWDDMRDNAQYDIYIQHVDSNGTRLWDEHGVRVCGAAGDQQLPVICTDGSGGCIVSWLDERDSEFGDVYAQRIDGDGNALWETDGIAVCKEDTTQTDLYMVPDGSGGAIMVWADYRGEALQLFGQKIGSDGTPAWAVDGVRMAPSSNPQYGHKIATDDHGGVYIAWSERRINTQDIYLQRVSSSGSEIFTSGGLGICLLNETQRYPEITADGEGGAIVIWEDYRSFYSDLYGQRIDAGGNSLWPVANGTPVCLFEPGSILYPTLCSDGSGGAIIAWADNRNAVASSFDLYAQRIDGSGTALWDTDGKAFSEAYRNQCPICATTNGKGGVILAWRDYRNPDFDIYAQMVTDEGTVVGTRLQGFTSRFRDNAVRIEWRLSQAGWKMKFYVTRREIGSGDLEALDPSSILREGLRYELDDRTYRPGMSYVYSVDVEDEDGRFKLFETEPVVTPASSLDLGQNYPNPFNPATEISYLLEERCPVILSVYDVSGRLVARLTDRVEDAGPHTVSWDGRWADGSAASSGIYFYRLKAGKKSLVKKMVLLR